MVNAEDMVNATLFSPPNPSNHSELTTGEISSKNHAQHSTGFFPNLGQLVENLKIYANESDIEHAIQLLKENTEIITQLKDDYSTIIEHFYPPYSIAYKQRDFEFCYEYGITLDKLTGVSGILFMDEYQ